MCFVSESTFTQTTSVDHPAVSGEQYRISFDDQEAVITQVGAAVREYRVGNRDVFVPFAETEVNPVSNAAILAPWPNRLRGGKYTFDGADYQVAVTEPDRMNALHGLASWQLWTAIEQTPSSVTMRLDLPAQKGWPFQLRLEATYTLGPSGLSVKVTATNIGRKTAPYGIGFHPWLSSGGANLDDCEVQLDATEHVTVDDRLLPTGVEPVDGDKDLRRVRSLAGLDLDDAWVGATYDEDGRSWCVLRCPDGRMPAVWMDRSMDCWQVCSADHIPAHYRFGLAAEPMSCYADAFNTGDRLVRLAPGESHTVRWGALLG